MPPRKKICEGKVGAEPVTDTLKTPTLPEGRHKRLRGRRGGLRDMPNMPLDVIIEILRLIDPCDLLSLARTSKPFRGYLLNRNSEHIWKRCRSMIDGLPDCPKHLSEPAYANLIFSPHCHSCLKPDVQKILWNFSKRYCPSCLKVHTKTAKEWRSDNMYNWALTLPYKNLFNTVVLEERKELYHCLQLDYVQRAREALWDDSFRWEAFMKEQQEYVRAIDGHAALCLAWDKKRLEERGRIITARLMLLGKVIDTARLSQRHDWSVMDGCKPYCRDLAMLPEVRRLIEAPNDALVDEKSLRAIVSRLPVLEVHWRRKCETDLKKLLHHDEHLEAQCDVDPLNLAVVVFWCNECTQPLHYPHVLTHECHSSSSILPDSSEYQYTDYYKWVFESCGRRRPWSVSSFQVTPKLDQIRALIEVLGKDPNATTHKDMDDMGNDFVACDKPYLGYMSWQRVLYYIHRQHSIDITHRRVATREDCKALKERPRVSSIQTLLSSSYYLPGGSLELLLTDDAQMSDWF